MICKPKLRVLYGNVGSAFDVHASSCSAMPLYRALDQHVEMIGSLDAEPHRFQHVIHTLGAFHPSYRRWKERRYKSMWTFDYQSMIAAKRVRQFADQFDIYFQQRALFDPAWVTEKPYVIYTDATHAMTLKFWPDWSPFSDQELVQWLEEERRIYEKASCLFTKSQFAADSMINDYGLDPAKVHAVGTGVNFNEIPEHAAYDGRTLLFCGYDFERKGGPCLLDSFPLIRHQLPGTRLLIVGPQKPWGELPDGVEWIGPIKDRQKVSALMSKASLFVLPSYYDPLGNVFIEAMRHQLPVITSDRCGAKDAVLASHAGQVIPVDAPMQMTTAIVDLLKQPEELAAMGRRGEAYVKEHFNWQSVTSFMAEKMEDVL